MSHHNVSVEPVDAGRAGEPGEDVAMAPGPDDRGMTTAEYAIGVVMVIALVIVVIKAIQGGWLAPLIMALVQAVFKLITLQMGL